MEPVLDSALGEVVLAVLSFIPVLWHLRRH